MAFLMTDMAAGSDAALKLQQNMAAAPDVQQAQANKMQEAQVKLQQDQENLSKTRLSNIVSETGIKSEAKKQDIVANWMKDPANANKSAGDMASGLSAAFMGAGLVEDGEKLSTAAANAEYKQALVKSKEAAQQMQVVGSAYSTIADASPEQFKTLLGQMSKEQKDAITKSIPKFFEETDPKLQKSQLEHLMMTSSQQIMQQKLVNDAQIHADRNAAIVKAAEIRVNGMIAAKAMGGSGNKEDMAALKGYDTAERIIDSRYKPQVTKAEANLAALEEQVAVSKAKSWFGTPDKTIVAKLDAASKAVKELDDKILADKIKAAKMLPPSRERTSILSLLSGVESPSEEEAPTDKPDADKAKPDAAPSPTVGGKPTPAVTGGSLDQQAMAWAKANPTDPRSKAILEKAQSKAAPSAPPAVATPTPTSSVPTVESELKELDKTMPDKAAAFKGTMTEYLKDPANAEYEKKRKKAIEEIEKKYLDPKSAAARKSVYGR
jgi:hypothetical protein